MTSLQETIEHFQTYVLEEDSTIEKEIVGPNAEFKKIRLGAYQTAYFLRLLEVLSEDFPITKKLMGKELFESLAQVYINHFPSEYFSVRQIGTRFSLFLKECSTIDPLVGEMSEFEWALRNTVDAPDAPYLTFEALLAIQPNEWSTIRFKPHPSLKILSCYHKAPLYWQYLMLVKEQPDCQRQDEPTDWIVWRFNQQPYFRALEAHQLEMLKAIQSDATFAEVCMGCGHLEEDKWVMLVAQTLRTWIADGIFSEMRVPMG